MVIHCVRCRRPIVMIDSPTLSPAQAMVAKGYIRGLKAFLANAVDDLLTWLDVLVYQDATQIAYELNARCPNDCTRG